jgi:molybdopterin biosynthesis enzyme
MKMEKWADYGISAVQYNSDRSRIIKVRVHQDNGDKIGTPTEWSRSDVVSSIEKGTTFVTILSNNNQWNKGADVHLVTINGVKCIRTDKNSRAADNLENLPEF